MRPAWHTILSWLTVESLPASAEPCCVHLLVVSIALCLAPCQGLRPTDCHALQDLLFSHGPNATRYRRR